MGNRLELTWYGKENPRKIEPRLLIENTQLSVNSDNGITDNLLIHGDNLLALKALEKKYNKQVKCIYIDPPYNINAANEHYDDFVEHSMWLHLMRERLILLKGLLAKEGSIWIQIDDEEMAYLKVLCDEVFGRNNYVNTLSVNMKNIAGVSGGGEDKRLKKNCEFILIYARNYPDMELFKPQYVYTELSELIQQYMNDGKSWKYTSVLIDPGEKEYYGSTVDGDGNEIKVYLRKNSVMMSIKQVATRDGITEKEAYKKYGISIFQTTNAQSSIRTRVMDYKKEENIEDDLISIEYTPRSGKNKGTIYEQFYKGDKCRLFVWLRDTSEVINDKLYKKDLLGTYWDMNAWMKNVAKEGNVEFPNSKKPEQLIAQIFDMATNEGDLVLDSFLGSGTTIAVAHKMKRRWIGIEMGDHAYTHCKKRIDTIIKGADEKGITSQYNWQNGGGYKFFEIAPSLIQKDEFDENIINPEYDANMLAAAVALHEGFVYSPSATTFWKQAQGTENSFLFVTTRHINREYLDSIASSMSKDEFLIIACRSYDSNADCVYPNISIKKIPQMLLEKCEFSKDDYSLNIINPPIYEDELDDEEECDE